MNIEQLQQMVQWLNQQIEHLNESIIAAHQTNNYGRKIQHEGMRDAFMKCLEKINIEKGEKGKIKTKTSNKSVKTNI